MDAESLVGYYAHRTFAHATQIHRLNPQAPSPIAARPEDEKQSPNAGGPAHDTRTQQAKTAREQGSGFQPFRRSIRYLPATEASIRPLLSKLSFTGGKVSWGSVFRRGLFRIEVEDYRLIAEAMGVTVESLSESRVS